MRREAGIGAAILGLGAVLGAVALFGSSWRKRVSDAAAQAAPGLVPGPAAGPVTAHPGLSAALDEQVAALVPEGFAWATAIREEVIRQNPDATELDVRAALAWSDWESGLGQQLIGDRTWAQLHPDRYERFVVNRELYARNSWRGVPGVWCSYGASHLLAAHYLAACIQDGRLPPTAPPWALASPAICVPVGVAVVRTYLAEAPGETFRERYIAARGRAAGCGRDGVCGDPRKRAMILRRAAHYGAKWNLW